MTRMSKLASLLFLSLGLAVTLCSAAVIEGENYAINSFPGPMELPRDGIDITEYDFETMGPHGYGGYGGIGGYGLAVIGGGKGAAADSYPVGETVYTTVGLVGTGGGYGKGKHGPPLPPPPPPPPAFGGFGFGKGKGGYGGYGAFGGGKGGYGIGKGGYGIGVGSLKGGAIAGSLVSAKGSALGALVGGKGGYGGYGVGGGLKGGAVIGGLATGKGGLIGGFNTGGFGFGKGGYGGYGAFGGGKGGYGGYGIGGSKGGAALAVQQNAVVQMSPLVQPVFVNPAQLDTGSSKKSGGGLGYRIGYGF